jgi:hypothetical protein
MTHGGALSQDTDGDGHTDGDSREPRTAPDVIRVPTVLQPRGGTAEPRHGMEAAGIAQDTVREDAEGDTEGTGDGGGEMRSHGSILTHTPPARHHRSSAPVDEEPRYAACGRVTA